MSFCFMHYFLTWPFNCLSGLHKHPDNTFPSPSITKLIMKISISASSSTLSISLFSYFKLLSSSQFSPYFFLKNLQTTVIIAKWIIYGVRIWLSQMPVLLLFQTSSLNYIGKGHFLISSFGESTSLFGTLVRRWELAIILSHSENTWKLN